MCEPGNPKANARSPKCNSRWQNWRANAFTTSAAKLECPICRQINDHQITKFETWKKGTVADRWELAKKPNVCFLCLRRNHRTWRCTSKDTCAVQGYGQKHHSQLHKTDMLRLNLTAATFHPMQTDTGNAQQGTTPETHASCGMIEEPIHTQRIEKVALQMVPVILEGRNGIRIKANAFLDGGSSLSYLREQVADTLGLKAERRQLRISVFGVKTVTL